MPYPIMTAILIALCTAATFHFFGQRQLVSNSLVERAQQLELRTLHRRFIMEYCPFKGFSPGECLLVERYLIEWQKGELRKEFDGESLYFSTVQLLRDNPAWREGGLRSLADFTRFLMHVTDPKSSIDAAENWSTHNGVKFYSAGIAYRKFESQLTVNKALTSASPWSVFYLTRSLFLHLNAWHLGIGLLLIFIVGTWAERRLGAIKLASVYLVGAIVISLLANCPWIDIGQWAMAAGSTGGLFAVTVVNLLTENP